MKRPNVPVRHFPQRLGVLLSAYNNDNSRLVSEYGLLYQDEDGGYYSTMIDWRKHLGTERGSIR